MRNLATATKNPTKKKCKELECGALCPIPREDDQLCNMLFLCFSRNFSFEKQQRDPHDKQEGPDTEQEKNLLEVFSDADWVGDKSNRWSVSGSVIFLNGQFVYSYSRTQKADALSSGESGTRWSSECSNRNTSGSILVSRKVYKAESIHGLLRSKRNHDSSWSHGACQT